MARQRIHNEYFRTVSLGNRRSCPACSEKLAAGESVWSWGEYVHGKWRTVTYFCRTCWSRDPYSSPQARLLAHKAPCGCAFQLIAYGGSRLPAWLSLDTQEDSR